MGIAYFKPSAMLSARLSSRVVFDVEVLSVVVVSFDTVVVVETVSVVAFRDSVVVFPEDVEVLCAVVVVGA